MFGLFKKDPVKKLDEEYKALLEQGMLAQRNGDMRAFAELTERANKTLKDLEAIRNN